MEQCLKCLPHLDWFLRIRPAAFVHGPIVVHFRKSLSVGRHGIITGLMDNGSILHANDALARCS